MYLLLIVDLFTDFIGVYYSLDNIGHAILVNMYFDHEERNGNPYLN